MLVYPVIENQDTFDQVAYRSIERELRDHLGMMHGDKMSPSDVLSAIGNVLIDLRMKLEDLPAVFQIEWYNAHSASDKHEKCFVTAHLIRSFERAQAGKPLS